MSTECTPHVTREVYARYPHDQRQQAAFCWSLLIWLGAVFSTDPVLSVLQEIMTETGIWGSLSMEACGRSILVNSEVNMRSILVNSEVNKVPNSVKQVLNSVKLVKQSLKPVKRPCKPAF